MPVARPACILLHHAADMPSALTSDDVVRSDFRSSKWLSIFIESIISHKQGSSRGAHPKLACKSVALPRSFQHHPSEDVLKRGCDEWRLQRRLTRVRSHSVPICLQTPGGSSLNT